MHVLLPEPGALGDLERMVAAFDNEQIRGGIELADDSWSRRWLAGSPGWPRADAPPIDLSLTSPVKLTASPSAQIEKTAHSNPSPADQSCPGNSVERL